MSQFAKFRAAIISKAIYGDNEEPGYSTVQADFPYTEESGVAYGKTLSEIQSESWWRGKGPGFTVGTIRDPADPYYKSKAWIVVPDAPLLVGRVLTDGVDSSQDWARPLLDSVPAACLVIVTVTAASVLAAIDAAPTHFVLGVWNPDLSGDPLGPGLEPYDIDVEMPGARWTELRNGMVALGISATAIDNWRSTHPNATPRDVGLKFKDLIT